MPNKLYVHAYICISKSTYVTYASSTHVCMFNTKSGISTYTYAFKRSTHW